MSWALLNYKHLSPFGRQAVRSLDALTPSTRIEMAYENYRSSVGSVRVRAGGGVGVGCSH